MATSTTTARAKGCSDNPAGKRLRAKSVIGRLDRIGPGCSPRSARRPGHALRTAGGPDRGNSCLAPAADVIKAVDVGRGEAAGEMPDAGERDSSLSLAAARVGPSVRSE
jgi:hypothetical protein